MCAGHASSARHRRRNRIQSQIAAKLDGGSPSAEPEVCGTVASSADVSGSTTAPNVVVSTDLSCAESGTNKATQESSESVPHLHLESDCSVDVAVKWKISQNVNVNARLFPGVAGSKILCCATVGTVLYVKPNVGTLHKF